jgi:hypothetical protein
VFALEFERLGGLDALEPLQLHENIVIYNAVIEILDNHFEAAEDIDLKIDNEGTDA